MSSILFPSTPLLSSEAKAVRDQEISANIKKSLPSRKSKIQKNQSVYLSGLTKHEDQTHRPAKRSCKQSSKVSTNRTISIKQELKSQFIEAQNASLNWPPIIDDRTIVERIQKFRDFMIEDNHPTSCCAVCSQLVSPADRQLLASDSDEIKIITTHVAVNGHQALDNCARDEGGGYHVCKKCFVVLRLGKVPRLAMLNGLQSGCCQEKPRYLAGLTQLEEMVIARGRSFGSVLKLRPHGVNPGACYRRVKGHIVVVPLEPQSLLDILSSCVNDLIDRIQVIWIGKEPPTEIELRPWLQIRKSVVVRALEGLSLHNSLYQHVQVDSALLARWPDVCIPEFILKSIIVENDIDQEAQERSDYVNTELANHETQKTHSTRYDRENLNVVKGFDHRDGKISTKIASEEACEPDMPNSGLEEDSLHASFEQLLLEQQIAGSQGIDIKDGGQECTGSVLTDLEGNSTTASYEPQILEMLFHQTPGQKVSFANALEVEPCCTSGPKSALDRSLEPPSQFKQQHQTSEVLMFKHQRTTLLNDYENPEYFTATFPTLFWTGHGGHLVSDQYEKLSFESWAKWLINHHSRRFSRHTVFMYLVYDHLVRRKSAISHSLLVKRSSWSTLQTSISNLSESNLLEAARALKAKELITNQDISNLLNLIKSIGAIVPNSYQQRSKMRVEMKSMVVRHGVPALWFTLNPSDLRNPLVLKLSGVEIDFRHSHVEAEAGERFNSTFCAITATMNPSSVATFFHLTVEAFFEHLVLPDSGRSRLKCNDEPKSGIFGPAETYYAAVETNGRGMLHLHGLIWLRGNLQFSTLRERVLEDESYGLRVIRYLESVIRESVHEMSSSQLLWRSRQHLPPVLNAKDLNCADLMEL